MLFAETATLCFFIVVLFSIWWYKSVPKNLPPGPRGLPLVGCALHFLVYDHVSLLKKWTEKYGPLISFYMGNKLVLILGTFESIDEALVKQGDVFSGRPFFELFTSNQQNPKEKNGIIFMDGPEWKEQRRFALNTLRDFGFGRPILQNKINEEVDYLLDGISSHDGRPFDIQSYLNKSVSNVICSVIFGHRFDDEEFWNMLSKITFRASKSQITFMSSFIYFPWIFKLPIMKQGFENAQRESIELNVYIDKIVKQTAETFNPNDSPTNYVHAFLKAKKQIEDENLHMASSFTNANLVGCVDNIFVAGSETTSTTLRWGILLMAKNLHIQEKVFKEISDTVGTSQIPTWEDRSKLPYTEACILEIMRLANLAPMSVIHRNTADTILMGYHVPSDTNVIPFLWNVLIDPKYFPNPDEFNPKRFLDENNKVVKNRAFIPFSTGKRICLGESLAKMELFLFFTAMITRFKFTFPPGKQMKHVKRFIGVTTTPEKFDICAHKRQ